MVITNNDEFIVYGVIKQVWCSSVIVSEAQALLEGIKLTITLIFCRSNVKLILLF